MRTPDETVGDLYAQTSCNDVGARALLGFMDEFDLDTIDPLSHEIIARSEEAMRSAIREIPNGVHRHETWSDGFEDPILIKAKVTIDDEDIFIDFAGSSPESVRGINVVFNYTHAYASFAMKAAITPDVPHNDGAFRPVHVSAPPGSILNCLEPAAVASRHLIGHFLPGVVFGALADALPERLMAPGSDPIWISIWRGRSRQSTDRFTFSLFQCGGAGARAAKDGLNTTGFPQRGGGRAGRVPGDPHLDGPAPQGTANRLRRTGQVQGGLGQWTEMGCRTDEAWTVSAMVDRISYPPEGLLGGEYGAAGEFMIDGAQEGEPKRLLVLDPDTRVQLNLPGGGGYGDPLTRDPEAVLWDVIEGYVSIDGAKRDYGVVVEYLGRDDQLVRLPGDYRLDLEATALARRTGSYGS